MKIGTMMRIVPLDRHLLSRLVESERDPLSAEMACGPLFADRAMLDASFGLAFALIDGAEVPVGGGLRTHWHGRAEGWWMISHTARRRHLVAAARFSRAFMDRRQRDPAFRRIEVNVRSGWPDGFALSMGFHVEGTHRAWDPLGRDYRSFARVRA